MKPMYSVYVLRSEKDANLYVGCTGDLAKRLEAHRRGKVFSTKSRLPLKLVHQEQFEDKYEAYKMERFYKTAGGKRLLKSKLRNL